MTLDRSSRPYALITLTAFLTLTALTGACAEGLSLDHAPTPAPEAPSSAASSESLDPEAIQALSDDEACQAASAHLAACLGLAQVEAQPVCDPASARESLAASCQALASGPQGKGDLFGWTTQRLEALACSMGWDYYCDPLSCQAPEGVTTCQQLRGLQGCQECAYYTCMERQLDMTCGPRGYFEGYGQKYCQRFSAITAQKMSPRGQQWVKDVRGCLMDELALIAQGRHTCAQVKQRAFDSHPRCYVQTGLCELGPGDWLHIVNTIAPWDNDLRQVVVSGIGCLQRWVSGR